MPELNVGRKQGILLVLALLLLGGVSDCLLGQGQATAAEKAAEAGEEMMPPLPYVSPVGPEPQRRYVIDVRDHPRRRTRPMPPPGLPPYPSLYISYELPAGEEKGVLTVVAGEEGRKLPGITVRPGEGHYIETLLHMEKRRYVLKSASGKSWTVETQCPPLPRSLRAVGAPDRITLMWESPDTAAGTWTKKPEIVILRSDLKDAREGKRPGKGRLRYAPFKEVGRIESTASEYQDRAVVPGETYIYRVAVEGEVEVSLTRSDTGDVATESRKVRGVAPVRNALYGVVATAELPKPLRVAAVTKTTHALPGCRISCSLAAQVVRDALPELPWVLVTVRDDPQAVASEKAVARMGQDERGVSAFDLVPAEVCLRVDTPRFLVDEVQVWLEDYLNGRHVLLARASRNHPKRLLKQVYEALPRYFPERAKIKVAQQEGKTKVKRPRLAVAALRPATGASAIQLSRGTLHSLLASELASSSRFQVVDREWTDAAFAEQERLALRGEDGMGELGHTLGADYLLSGTYGVQGEELVLEAHLIDVAHGTKSNRVTCRGRLDDIAGAARQLGAKLRVPRSSAELGSAIPLRLAFDIDRSLGLTDYRDRIDIATLGRSRDHEEVLMAVDRQVNSDPQQAQVLLRRLLDQNDRKDPRELFGLVCRLDALLQGTGKVRERVQLWRRAMADVPDQKVWTELGLHAFLSEALCDGGEMEEARKWMRPGPGRLHHVLVYEKLGLREEAWLECLHAPWLVWGKLGPGYIGAVFLLHGASAAERGMILSEISRRLPGELPHQINRALLELERDGPLPDDLWGISLCNAAQLGDETRCKTALANLHRLPDRERIIALSRAMSYAAEQGEGAVAEEMMGHIRTMQPKDTRARKRQRARLRQGIPEIKAPHVAFAVLRSQVLDALDADRWLKDQDGNTLCFLSEGKGLVAYDRRREEILWQLDLDALTPHEGSWRTARLRRVVPQRWTPASIATGSDLLYVPVSRQGRLLAVDRSDGSVRWSYTCWGRASAPILSADETRVVVADALGAFVVLDARSGKLLKRIPLRNLAGWLDPCSDYGITLRPGRPLSAEYRGGRHGPWVYAVPGGLQHLPLNRYLPPALRGDRVACVDPAGRVEPSCSLNMETLECTEVLLPVPEPMEEVLATLADRTLPAKQRARRLSAAARSLPTEALQAVLMEILQNLDEPREVSHTALVLLARHNPSKAVVALAEILNAPVNRTKRAATFSYLLGEERSAGLDDEAVQALVRLTDHPSLSVRRAAGYSLVCAVGAASLPHIKSLLAMPPSRLDGRWRETMARMMARKGMPEAMVFLRPLLDSASGSDPYLQRRSNGALLIMARNGNKEALDLVVVPFDEKAHLARLRKAKSPVSAKDLRELAKPYRWISRQFPMPRFAPFVCESLKVAPFELHRGIVSAYVRVAGREALAALVQSEMEASVRCPPMGERFWRVGQMIELVTGIGSEYDTVAWEQELRPYLKADDKTGDE